jgi:hypothetical protein
VIGILFFEETHAEKKHRRDVGIEAGRWLLRSVPSYVGLKLLRSEKAVGLPEIQPLIENDDPLPGYRTTEGSPELRTTASPELDELLSLDSNYITIRRKPAVAKAFTRQVILNIVDYGILA